MPTETELPPPSFDFGTDTNPRGGKRFLGQVAPHPSEPTD
jgi:hypothetical protein